MNFARSFDRATATRRTRSWAALLIVAVLVGIATERLLPAGDARQARAGAGASAQTAAGCVSSADVVCTDAGAVRGSLSRDVRVFKGILYAKPPVGNLRFRPTQPADHWQGIRAADQFGPICPQVNGDRVIGSEDCLTVNVWTPQQPPAMPLPVMIWLHGGGNRGSSGSLYDGSLMVRRGGVVFVTYNLRLGVLGFMAHASLDAERAEKISGNYGNLDQIAMLQWVKVNIRNFGGDPNRVFVFGSSAGGGNICALMTSPLAQGLFHGASMESSVPSGCELQTLAQREQGTGARIVAAVHCTNAKDIAGCLRSRSVEEIVGPIPGYTDIFTRAYGPSVDGHVFPDQPIKMIQAKRYKPIPVIIGTSAAETREWLIAGWPALDPATYSDLVKKLFGPKAHDAILAHYPVMSFPTPLAALEAVTVDAYFSCTSRRVAHTLASVQTEPVYQYFFTHETDPKRGAGHSAASPFHFPWAARNKPSSGEQKLHDMMVLYWSRMARTGDPNGAGTPVWPRYEPGSHPYLELTTPPAPKSGLRKEQCDFWDTIPLQSPHL